MSRGVSRGALEQALPHPKPVFAATLLKSAAGKGKRSKREAFLRTCGLNRMGDTVHLPVYEELQQERALALICGLHALERGVVRIERLSNPAALVVSDDRGLRRRCFALRMRRSFTRQLKHDVVVVSDLLRRRELRRVRAQGNATGELT